MKVYISGPYTEPDPVENTKRALETADVFLHAGLIPYVPHLSMFWHFQSPKAWDIWLDYDLSWIESCDVLFRMQGKSKGADLEVQRAKELGMPVFTSYVKLIKWVDEKTMNGGD